MSRAPSGAGGKWPHLDVPPPLLSIAIAPRETSRGSWQLLAAFVALASQANTCLLTCTTCKFIKFESKGKWRSARATAQYFGELLPKLGRGSGLIRSTCVRARKVDHRRDLAAFACQQPARSTT